MNCRITRSWITRCCVIEYWIARCWITRCSKNERQIKLDADDKTWVEKEKFSTKIRWSSDTKFVSTRDYLEWQILLRYAFSLIGRSGFLVCNDARSWHLWCYQTRWFALLSNIQFEIHFHRNWWNYVFQSSTHSKHVDIYQIILLRLISMRLHIVSLSKIWF